MGFPGDSDGEEFFTIAGKETCNLTDGKTEDKEGKGLAQ